MAKIQISSAEKPFDRPELGRPAVEVLGLSEAMGLLPKTAEFNTLNWATVHEVAKYIAKAGIARALIGALDEHLDSAALGKLLTRLAEVLRENPAPKYEWGRLQQVFPPDELAMLLGISATSVARYRAHRRRTPDEIAARLHFLARILHHLEGAYDELGVRRWFVRPRTALDRKAPADVLKKEWDPDSREALRVLELAGSLSGSAAT
jgi:uncharacterized protein (DUF2384 family)